MNTCEPLPNEYYKNIELLPNCPAILTLKEVVHVCNISLPTIQRMVKDGSIPVNCDGEIRRSDLIEYIKNNTLADKKIL